MIIKRLLLANLRAYTKAEFEFQPGMNLLVGINGVGKTTALEALRICLSQIQPEISVSANKKENFGASDIKIGNDNLNVICDFELSKQPIKLEIDFKYEITTSKPKINFFPELEKLSPLLSLDVMQPIGIFFSTRRSLMVDREPTKTMSVGGQAAAFADALSSNREFNLRVFTDWIRTQMVLGEENPDTLKSVQVLSEAIYRFLPGFSNLQIKNDGDKYTLTIEKGKTTLNIDQLSDGERGMLALVMDIARRLYQANPGLKDPLKEGKGVILIDELDLHLHPKWQRSIVENLTRAFPCCQFIVSTHSPQIIGEVQPNSITIIDNGINKPASSFGMDSNRVLEEILDAAPRNRKVNTLLNALYKYIDEEKITEAKEQIGKLIVILGPDDPEITRSSTMISFLEDELADETDNKD
ncbi:AAA family ATPase [Chitinophaga polysaccharea]|uniref:AAA family ATPase n=1 Tax=Chitinophaga polysaccharea TaxID=1293035 RepID=UPI0014558985|nr:AAA family ATPase [Chitinophaga polysaccharea]NLR59385.1 AAA family ATPase [Chitinophaga polysaccharea]